MAKRHINRSGDLESLFLRLEELVLANSGEDEFEEVFKLLIAKLWDEIKGKHQFRTYKDDTETAKRISELLREAEKNWPGILEEAAPRLTPEHLAVCVEALSHHMISGEGLEVMDGFFEFIVSKESKGSKGQYFTPRNVIELCVRMLKPTQDENVLDPACGSGGFLIHALNFVQPNDIQKYCKSNIWGFDMDNRAIRVAKALMILAGDGSSNIIRLNSLLQPNMVACLFNDEDSLLTIEDVCRSRMRRHKGFDVILTNPPFAGEVREKTLLQGYEVAKGKSRIERDVLFIERCVKLLRPGGRMAIILPHNKFASGSNKFVRDWIFRKARILAVVSLGRNTFLPHTHQKASILFLQRHQEGVKCNRDYNIFFAISERDGKNSKGQFVLKNGGGDSIWDKVEHDFSEIVDGFEKFCRREKILET